MADSEPIKEGDLVHIPVKRKFSFLHSGKVIVITGEYVRVEIIEYGRKTWRWTGKLSEVRKSYAVEKES